jgi:hypothetical protein
MSHRRYPVLIESAGARKRAGFNAPAGEQPFRITMKLRERGWNPYRVRFDAGEGAWIVSVIDWKSAA